MFDTSRLEWPPPPVIPPPEEDLDDLVEDLPGIAEPVRWSEYLPDGMLADLLAQPAQTDPEHREFETLERVGGWERIIAWAQARQIREMTSFMDSAQARNKALGAYDSQAYDSAVAEVGLMLTASARTAAFRVGDAWSLCTRLPATLAALESGRITLAKARIVDAETLNLSEEHTAAVEARVLAKAPKQTPGQLRAATRRAVLNTDPAAARERAQRARRERGVQIWPEPDGMATLSAHLPAADAVGVFAVLDEHARRAGLPGDERTLDARRGDALVDLVLNPTGSALRPPALPATTAPRNPAVGSTAPPTPPTPPAPPAPPPHPALPPTPPRPPALPAAGASADGAGAGVAWMFGSPSPTPRYWAPTTNPASWPATDPSRPRWPATSPPGAPGGASSPTQHRAGHWTTAPPATGHQHTWPGWSSPEIRPASSRAAGYRPTAATSTTALRTAQRMAPARPVRQTLAPSVGDIIRSSRPPAGR